MKLCCYICWFGIRFCSFFLYLEMGDEFRNVVEWYCGGYVGVLCYVVNGIGCGYCVVVFVFLGLCCVVVGLVDCCLGLCCVWYCCVCGVCWVYCYYVC